MDYGIQGFNMYLKFKDEHENPVVVNFNLVEMWEIKQFTDGSLGIEIQFSSGKFQSVRACMHDIERALMGDITHLSMRIERKTS